VSAAARLVLASASPRRRELLARAGLCFEIEPAGVAEDLPPGIDPLDAARTLAERKARVVAGRHARPVFVLAADTVVALGPRAGACELLGKPATASEAAGMLRALSGTRHAVVTGLCVVRAEDQAAFVDAERTWVTMRPLAEREIADYVASGEWRDMAGGYAIQESAERFVTALEGGGHDNVVGLPVARALALLQAAGAPPEWRRPPGARLAGESGAR
jgi:septum formation protein